MNIVNMIGRLTKPVTFTAGNGEKKSVARFTLAVNRDKEHADFPSCVAFGKSAEILNQYTDKGSQIGISGSVRTGKYTNQNGSDVYYTEITVNRVYFLGNKGDAAENAEKPAQSSGEEFPGFEEIAEECPF